MTGVAPEALAALEAYHYPGNVRELENIVERALTLSRADRIDLECLPTTVLEGSRPESSEQIPEEGVDLDRMICAFESGLIKEALKRSGGVKKKAAHLLGVSFRSLRYRLEKLGLNSD